MKQIAASLILPVLLAACDPFPKDEDSQAKPATPQATATPKPTPAPGAWMYEKRENPLDVKPRH